MKFDAKGIIILILSAVLFTMMLPVLSYVIQDNFTEEECEVCEEQLLDIDYLYLMVFDADEEQVPFELPFKILKDELPEFAGELSIITYLETITSWDISNIEYLADAGTTTYYISRTLAYSDTLYLQFNILSSGNIVGVFNNHDNIINISISLSLN